MRSVATILSAERDRLAISNCEVARRADAPVSLVQAVMSGTTADPRIGTVIQILTGLGRSLTWLERQLRVAPPPA